MPLFKRHSRAKTFYRQPENFWEPGNYKQVLNRLKHGYEMTQNMILYMQERVLAEEPSDKRIQRWAAKWSTGVSRNPHDQGMVAQILTIINDAHSQRIEINNRMKTVVMGQIIPKLRNLKHFTKRRGLKELDKQFRQIQKPWAKSLKKVSKIKMIYHEACRVTDETTEYLESGIMPSGHGMSEMTPEQREKIKKRHDDYAIEVERCRTVYEAALYELNFGKNEYMQGMRSVFDKCVALEKERMSVFQECLQLFAKVIDSGRDVQYTKVWEQVDVTLLNYTVDRDLEHFSTTLGPGMQYKWPAFEEWANRPSQIYND